MSFAPFIYIPSETNSSHLKMDGWKMFHFLLKVSAHFAGVNSLAGFVSERAADILWLLWIGGTGVSAAIGANRLSFTLGLRGSSATIDTACGADPACEWQGVFWVFLFPKNIEVSFVGWKRIPETIDVAKENRLFFWNKHEEWTFTIIFTWKCIPTVMDFSSNPSGSSSLMAISAAAENLRQPSRHAGLDGPGWRKMEDGGYTRWMFPKIMVPPNHPF